MHVLLIGLDLLVDGNDALTGSNYVVKHLISAMEPHMQANPYYDYEDVIDSDEHLDLASMVTAL